MAKTKIPGEYLADGGITVAKMAANSIDSDQYVDGSIDLIHMSVNSIDSDQYVDGSIDTIHIADGAITSAKLDTNIAVGGTLTVTGDANFDSNTLFVDASANAVGIGTSSPAAPLHVQGTNSGVLVDTSTAYTPVIKASGALSDLKLSSIGNGGNLVLDAPGTTSIIQMSVNGSERLRIDSSGNVGIRNASPASLNSLGGNSLVIGDGTQTNNLFLYSATTGGTVGYGHIAFADSNVNGSSAQYAGLIQYYHGDNSMRFYTNSAERMRISSTGDLTLTSNTVQLAGSFENTNTSGYGMRITTYSNGVEYGLAVDSYGGGYSRDFTVGVNGNVNVLTGNLVIGTAGKGIDFSATSGTGTSELLDDYEEGTWTLTIATTGTAPSVTITNTTGTYTKIGRQVTCTIYTDGMNISSAGSGSLRLGGLPFSCSGGNSSYAVPSFGHTNCFASEAEGYVAINNNLIVVTQVNSIENNSLVVANPRYMMMTVTYFTDQ